MVVFRSLHRTVDKNLRTSEIIFSIIRKFSAGYTFNVLLDINEANLWFVQSLMSVFEYKIKLIERSNGSDIKIIQHLDNLIATLEARSSEKMLPLEVKTFFMV